MNINKIIVACVLTILTVASFSHADEWRGIKPLHSTCEDAKRLLGITKCETGIYDFKNETAFIWFSERPCADGWNVPPGTVTSLEVFPKKKIQLTDLGVDERRFKRKASQSAANPDRYIDEEEGLVITAYPDGEVKSIAYIPTTKDNYLRYPNSLADQPVVNGDPHSIIKFDEYGDIAVKEGQERLDNFASQLQSQPNMQGYIIAYGGRRAHVGEAQAQADHAKSYLVKRSGIESGRIVTVNGGYREQLTVELFVGVKGGAVPIASPTVCPSEVQIIKDSSAKAANRRSSRLRHK